MQYFRICPTFTISAGCDPVHIYFLFYSTITMVSVGILWFTEITNNTNNKGKRKEKEKKKKEKRERGKEKLKL